MKKIIIFLLFLIIAESCYAFQLKYYGNHYVVPKTYTNIIGIPSIYFKGIRTINIFQRNSSQYLGYYHNGGVIDLYGNTIDIDILIHELAHNCQAKIEPSFNLKHDNVFYACEKKIILSTNSIVNNS